MAKSMINVVTIRMEIPLQKRGEILKTIESVAELCKYDSGCFSCHIYGDIEKKSIVMLEEVWKSEEDLERHLRSDEFWNLLLAMKFAIEQPEIKFNTILSSTGMAAGTGISSMGTTVNFEQAGAALWTGRRRGVQVLTSTKIVKEKRR